MTGVKTYCSEFKKHWKQYWKYLRHFAITSGLVNMQSCGTNNVIVLKGVVVGYSGKNSYMCFMME